MAIKFEVVGEPSPSKTVRVQLQSDSDGDVALLVNGMIMLWLTTEGHICLDNSIVSAKEFKAVGFSITDLDEVRVV